MIKLIATDMDGTLLTPDKQLPAELPQLLAELYRRDITFAVTSGRSRTALTHLFADMAEEIIFICDNGACVIMPHETPVLHSMPQDVICRVLDLCQEIPDAVPVLCGFHHIYYPNTASRNVVEEVQRYYREFQVRSYEMLYAVDEPILKIAVCDMHDPVKNAYPVLHKAIGIDYELLISGDCWMDVMCKGITKGAAVTALQERLGLTRAETMVFGDYDNDITMLESADYSFAMENAPDRVKKHARFTAPSNTENGVVQIICKELGICIDI